MEDAGKLPEQEVAKKFVLGNFIETQEPVFEGSSVCRNMEDV